MEIQELLHTLFVNPTGWGFALLHIVLVVVYATWKNWGNLSWFGPKGLFRTPGGAIAVSLPIPEAIFLGLLFTMAPSASESLLIIVTLHMIRVRLAMLVLFGLPAFATRLSSGTARIMCMDHRLDGYANDNPSFVANHNGACGAFCTLTLVGFMPGLLVALMLLRMGVHLPVWSVWVFMFPVLFLFSKHWHVLPHIFADVLEYVFEGTGLVLSGIVFGSQPTIQAVAEHK